MKTYPNLTRQIPPGSVMLLYFLRTKHDARDCAGSTGHHVIPAKGCLKAAYEMDAYGDRERSVVPGHGVTLLWPSGRTRNVRA